MSTLDLDVDAYWWGRRESVNDCAERCHAYLRELAAFDGLFQRWFRPAGSRKVAQNSEVDLSKKGLRSLLNERVTRRDATSTADADQGLSLQLWTHAPDGAEAGLLLRCGSHGLRVPSPNCCLLSLPRSGRAHARILQISMLTRLLEIAIETWTPQWVVATNRSIRDSFLHGYSAPFIPGLITWISRTLKFEREPMNGIPATTLKDGTLVVLPDAIIENAGTKPGNLPQFIARFAGAVQSATQ
ncbi:MAG: hypothetical protein HYY18_11475 [Planctomycetes bacterium]|nr:hypothetical protein [Planctomycetota bacterium]